MMMIMMMMMMMMMYACRSIEARSCYLPVRVCTRRRLVPSYTSGYPACTRESPAAVSP